MRYTKLANALLALGAFALTWGFNLSSLRGQNGADGSAGNFLFSIDDISYFAIGIHGPVNGEDGGDGFLGGNGGNGGAGIFFLAGRDITHGLLLIAAPVTGGNGGNGSPSFGGGFGGDGGAGIFFSAGRDISHIVLEALAPVTGGNGGDGGSGFGGGKGGNGGDGIFFSAGRDIGNVALEVSAPVTGGNGGNGGGGEDGGNGGNAGDGIGLSTISDDSGGDIFNIELRNSPTGIIRGGDGGNGGDAFFAGSGGNGGNGVSLRAFGSINHVHLKNAGTIAGGRGGDGGGFSSPQEGPNAPSQFSPSFGGNGGHGVSLFALNGDIFYFRLRNLGTITGGDGGDTFGGNGDGGGEGGDGVHIEAVNGNVSNIFLRNRGTITGGNGGQNTNGIFTEGGNGGNGFLIEAGGNISTVGLRNRGTIIGGNGGNNNTTSDDSVGGNGGHGISLSGEGDINLIFLKNRGTITGGNGGDITTISLDIETQDPKAGHAGDGISIATANENDFTGNISNVFLRNSGTGTVTGGNGGSASDPNPSDDPFGGNGGNGISFTAGVKITDDDDFLPPTDTSNNITNVWLRNRGTVLGGNGGDAGTTALFDDTSDFGDGGGGAGEEGPDAGSVGGKGGHGISFIAHTGDISNIFLMNFGSVTGGNGGHADGDTINTGGIGGNGINFHAGLTTSDIEEIGFSDDILTVRLFNVGGITGGNGGDADNRPNSTFFGGNEAGHGGNGVSFTSTTGDIKDIFIVNGGSIIGGDGGDAGGGTTDTILLNKGGNGGHGIYFDAGDFDPVEGSQDIRDLENITIINYNLIAGGNGGDPGGSSIVLTAPLQTSDFGNGGDGILFDGGEGANIVVYNFGTIRGGNRGDGGDAGAGIGSNVDNVIVNNWGNIFGGHDSTDDLAVTGVAAPTAPALDGFGPAILISGNFNEINLRGFPVVHGVITNVSSTVDTNELNFQFSGVSPAAAAALREQLSEFLSETESTGIITFRGETYEWDRMVVELETSSYQLLGITPNQKAIGNNLDRFTSTPSDDMRNLLAAVDISGNIPWALDQLSPQRYQVYSDIAFAHANFNTLEIDNRLNNLRSGSESADTSGLSIASEIERRSGFGRNITLALQNPNRNGPWINQDPSKDGKTALEPETPPERERRFGTFISGNVVRGDIDGHGGDLDDSNFTIGGLMAGLDYKLTHDFVAGLLFSYGHTDADLDARGSQATVNTYSGGVYAGFQHGPWFGNGLATYSTNDYDSHRVVLPFFNRLPLQNRIARADTSGNHFALNLDGGYDFHPSRCLTLSPTLGLQYVNLDVDGFNETGAGAANLTVHSQNADSLRSRLGGRLEFRKAVNRCVVLALETRAAWQHEFLDDSRAITSQFIGAGLGPFSIRTTNPERDAALLGTGFNTTFHGFVTLFLDYDAQVGQANYLEQAGRGGLRVSF